MCKTLNICLKTATMSYYYYFLLYNCKFYTQVVPEIAIKIFLPAMIFGGQNQDVKPEARKIVGFWARQVILIGLNRRHLFILYYLLMDKESVILDICFIIFFMT